MISYYELLGMIKDDNQPEEIRFRLDTYEWNGSCYINKDEDVPYEERYLSKSFIEYEMLNEKCIEIIGKPKKIEELSLRDEPILYGSVERWLGTYVTNKERKICCAIETLSMKVNEIIEVLNEKEKIQDNQK